MYTKSVTLALALLSALINMVFIGLFMLLSGPEVLFAKLVVLALVLLMLFYVGRIGYDLYRHDDEGLIN